MDNGDGSGGFRPAPPSSPPSVVRLPGYWYVACLSGDLGRRRPVGRTVLGIPLALFRDGQGRAVAVLDRCPHRNVPLSCGQVKDGLLECCYHGWRFDAAGACRAVPGLVDEDADRRSRRATVVPVAEQDGFVWVVPDPEASPPAGPFAFPHVADPAYATVWRSVRLESTLHAALENTLDVPHTAFLHGGLFRGGREPVEIEVVVRHRADSVEAEYLGEPRPEGLAGRVLAPGGGVVTHFDRFFLPSIAQVEYRLGDSHLVTTSAFTPVSDFVTHLHAAVTFRLRLPHSAVRAAVTPIIGRILKQDAAILRQQAETIRRFQGEQFSSTELDVLGQQIWKMLRQAERGQAPAPEPGPDRERRVRMRV